MHVNDSINTGQSSIVNCYAEQMASANGNHAYTCTYRYKSIPNQTCDARTEHDPSEEPGPEGTGDCPEGQDPGTVNGVPTCVPGGGDGGGEDTISDCKPDETLQQVDGMNKCVGSGDDGDGEGGGEDGDGDGSGGDGDGSGDGGDGDGGGEDGDGSGGGGGGTGTETKPDQACKAGDTSLACAKFGIPPTNDGISRVSKTLSFLPNNVLGTTAACPADKTFSVAGVTFPITIMSQTCSLLDSYVKPMAILLAFFSAIFIVSGVSNRPE